MNILQWTVLVPAFLGALSGAGVWVCLWYQRIGWSITLTANIAWMALGVAIELWGLSVGMVIASSAQVHHLWKTRHEPFAGRRVPVKRTGPPVKRIRRHRVFRHEIPLQYAPGRAPAPTTALMPTIESEPRIAPPIGIICPCGCGFFAPSDFVAHLERNRGNLSHWAIANRQK